MNLQEITEHIENIITSDYHVTSDQLVNYSIDVFIDDYFFRNLTYKIERCVGVDLSALFDRMGILIDKSLFNFHKLCEVVDIIKNKIGFRLYKNGNKIEFILNSISHKFDNRRYNYGQVKRGFSFDNKEIINILPTLSPCEKSKLLSPDKKVVLKPCKRLFKYGDNLFIKTSKSLTTKADNYVYMKDDKYFSIQLATKGRYMENGIEIIEKEIFYDFYEKREMCDIILKNKKVLS